MRKLSAFQVILLAVFGALAVAGVLIFAFAVGGVSSTSLGSVTIWGTVDSTAFNAVLRQAADENTDLGQVTYVQKDSDTYQAELTDALASGRGPDLFIITQEYAVKDAGKIAEIPFNSLSQSQFENAFIGASNPFITQTGILAIPLAADPLVLYWNKDMLSSAGYSQPPAYWDELYAMTEKLTKRSESGSITQSGVAFGEFQNVNHAKNILAMLIMQAGGTITAYDNAGHLRTALVSKTNTTSNPTESAVRFYTTFADPSKDYYSWNRSLPNAQQSFAAGDLALYIGYASEVGAIARMNPNLNFTLAPMPQIRGTSRTLDAARVYGFAASRSGKNPAAAITAAYLLSAATNAEAFATALGIPSARRDLLNQQKSDHAELFRKMAIASYAWVDPDPVQTASIFRGMIENITSGSMSLSEAISRADQQLGTFLDQLQ